MKVDVARIQCPACSGSLRFTAVTGLQCSKCHQKYPILDGVPVLKVNIESDTALDLNQYEVDHPADPTVRARAYLPFAEAMQRHGISGGSCLEIGSGTGNLTAGLAEHTSFGEVHCSDISARFLTRLRSSLNDNPKLRYWLFDASTLPFKSQCMDAIFAQSVLHHILDYERALRDVYRVLKPGGIAMFGEPVMDNRALTSYCAALIVQSETKNPIAGFSSSEMKTLHAIRANCAANGKAMREQRETLASVEDKHLFVIDDMYRLSRSIGFKDFEYNNVANIERIGNDHKWRILTTLERYGGSGEKMKAYDFIFNELTETYGVALGNAAPFNFGHFVFRK